MAIDREHQRGGNGCNQALAGSAAGCETVDVAMEPETLLPRPTRRPEATRNISLDQMWPVHSAGGWPESLRLRREDVYEDRA